MRNVARLLGSGLLALGLLSACAGGPIRLFDATNPRIYAEAQDPASAAAWARAQDAIAAGEFERAWPDLTVVVEASPDLVRAHIAYQNVAREIGGEAEVEMRGFYRNLPDRPSPVPAYVKARLADTSYARGQALQEILQKDGSFAWAHLSLGRVRRGQGQLLFAVDAFEAAFVHDPSLHEARLERGDALALLGRLEEAAVDYEAYFAKRSDDYAALREYAVMLIYRLVRLDRALELLDSLDREFPGDLDLKMHRAAARWRARQPRTAITLYLEVLDVDPTVSRAALNVGLIYYDAMPQNDEDRRTWWPKARVAFRYFLTLGNPGDGHEAFERSLAVPFRLGVIEDLLGAEAAGSAAKPVTIDDFRLPPG